MPERIDSTTGRKPAWLLLGLLFLAFYGRYLIGLAPSGEDIVNQYLPYQELIRNAVRGGDAPFWNGMTFCGRPLMADIQVGVLYPPNWLHWFLPLPVGFALVLAFHGAWMAMGCWMLGRQLRLAAPAIALGTVLFCAAPFFTLKLSQGIILFIYVGAWWPWNAWAAARLIERPGFGRMAVLALGLGLSLLAGSPQLTYYGWIAVCGFALALAVAEGSRPGTDGDQDSNLRSRGGCLSSAFRRLGWVALAFVMALGLTAIQTAQTFHFVGNSFERGGSGAGFEYVTNGSLSPRLLWLLVNPGFLGVGHSEYGYYWGSTIDFGESVFYEPLWVLLLLVPLGGAAWIGAGREGRPRDRRHGALAVASITAVILGVLLALGEHSPLFKLFYQFVPGFDRFRVPIRLMVFVIAGQALLGALAYHALLVRGEGSNRRPILLWGGMAAVLAVIWAPFILREQIWNSLWRTMAQHPLPEGLDSTLRQQTLGHFSRHALRFAVTAAVGLLVAGGALRVIRNRERSRFWRVVIWLPPLAALIELYALAAPSIKDIWAGDYREKFYPSTELVEILRREHRGGRVLWLDNVIDWHVDQNQREVFPNRLIMHGLPEARGYDPVNARWIGEWTNLLAGIPPEKNPQGFMFVPRIARPAWLGVMGVDTLIAYESLRGFPDAPTGTWKELTEIPGLTRAGQVEFSDGTLGVYRNEAYRGLAFAAPMPLLMEGTDWKQQIYRAASLDDALTSAPERALVTSMELFLQEVSGSDGDVLAGEGLVAAMAKAVDERFVVNPLPSGANDYRYEIDFPQPALLCFSQSAYRGWRATIDDRLTPLATVNGAFQGVIVPAGIHEVAFDYYPDGLAAGKWISLGALVALIYGLARARVTGRREAIEGG